MFKPSLSLVSFVPSVSLVLATASVLATAGEARAQSVELVGVRAQGMGGAFTAVADDSTATWWNPAGLAGGAFINGIIEYTHPPGSDDSVKGVSAAFPALGISYYRLPLSQIRVSSAVGTSGPSEIDQGVLSVYGATVAQSFGTHLVIGSTIKLMRASDTSRGLDLGAMATFGRARLGVAVRNVNQPEFGSGDAVLKLHRQARAGFAFSTGARGVVGTATIAADADLTTTETPSGDERRFAVGGDAWAPGRSFALRGGLSFSTIGERRTTLSAGASVMVRHGTYFEASLFGGGNNDVRRGWGTALRVTF
jgi:F plasmid transfer operon protein TraF